MLDDTNTYFLNETGNIEMLKSISTYEEVMDFLLEKSIMSFFIFEQEDFISLKQSIDEVIVGKDDYFILNDSGNIENIGSFSSIQEADADLTKNNRSEDAMYIFSPINYQDFLNSIEVIDS